MTPGSGDVLNVAYFPTGTGRGIPPQLMGASKPHNPRKVWREKTLKNAEYMSDMPIAHKAGL
jgi:hypothetical protein